MTGKTMEVSRELLERVTNNQFLEKERISIARHEALFELRGLLAKTACIDCKETGFCLSITGDEIRCPCHAPIQFAKTATEHDYRTDLAAYWGLSYASWLTLPRVLMESMPPEWQQRMAVLLNDYEDALPNQPGYGTTVRITQNGRLVPTPDWLTNYRHPDRSMIAQIKAERTTEGTSHG